MNKPMKINPCLFCESKDVELITGKGKFDRVWCNSCGATGPWYDEHPEDAVADWNTAHLTSKSTRPDRAERIRMGRLARYIIWGWIKGIAAIGRVI